jgi:hypothetical protein
MPYLRNLTRDEADALIHKIRNSNRQQADHITTELIDGMTSGELEEKLAKVSEDENYLTKNRYRLQKTKLDFADKKRMPVDESKIKDMLRNK